MKIGFDAKRYFHNPTGLGNYSRTLVNGLAQLYPQHHYFLFNPKPARHFAIPNGLPLQEVQPQGFIYKKFPALWRSKGVVNDLQANGIELFHGLSHELPVGISKKNIRSVVTVHDLIFERYPHQYGTYEVRMHRRKIKYACEHANAVIAISQQTKQDLIDLYSVPQQKIAVCYQSCDPQFAVVADENTKVGLRKNFNLPQSFFLYVGSITERKNLLRICEGLKLVQDQLTQPLVVVGNGGAYAQKVKKFVAENGLDKSVIFLNDHTPSDPQFNLAKTENLAALYQMATALVYPSTFEGFGIPVLEALWSKTPVITSNTSCLPETGGDAALYVDPLSAEQIGAAMLQLQQDASLRNDLVQKGMVQVQKFTLEQCTAQVMGVYKKVMEHGSL